MMLVPDVGVYQNSGCGRLPVGGSSWSQGTMEGEAGRETDTGRQFTSERTTVAAGCKRGIKNNNERVCGYITSETTRKQRLINKRRRGEGRSKFGLIEDETARRWSMSRTRRSTVTEAAPGCNRVQQRPLVWRLLAQVGAPAAPRGRSASVQAMSCLRSSVCDPSV